MGLICYDNFIERRSSASFTGFTNGANLLSPQLSPRAGLSLAANNVADIRFASFQDVDYIALLGVRVSTTMGSAEVRFGYPIPFPFILEEWNGGSSFSEIPSTEFTLIPVAATATSEGHYIIKFRTRWSMLGFRLSVSPVAGFPYSVSAGHLRAGRVVEHESIAVKSGGFTIEDTATITASSAGQLYSSAGSSRRIVDVEHGLIPDWVVHGGLRDPKEISLPVANLTGINLFSGEYRTALPGATGQIEFSGVLDQGVWYRLEYDARLITSGPSPGTNFAKIYSNLTTGAGLDEPWDEMPFGRAHIHSRTPSLTVNLTIDLEVTGNAAIGISNIRLFKERMSSFGSPYDENIRTMDGLARAMGVAGKSNPVIVLMSPDSAVEASWTGYYGVIRDYQPLSRAGGNLSTGGFTLEEAL